MGRKFLVANLVALAVAAVALVVAELVPSSVPGAAVDWDDGKAELCRYAAQRMQYGKLRDFELTQVVVKESFDPATRTKPDAPRPGVVDALKLVRVEDVSTEPRPYHHRRTLTVRVARSDPWRLLDAACGTQDWCGLTFAILQPRGEALVKHVHSYFDGVGDREETFPAATLVEEQLYVALRAAPLAKGFEKTVSLLGPFVTNEQRPIAAVSATIRVAGEERVGDLACVHVTVERADQHVLEYWLGKEAPHVLARWKHGDGRAGTLTSIERTVYWRDP